MILRRLTKHVKDQNWFAVALDFVIVVIGVGVALLGQQWLSDRTQRADMRVAEAALQVDMFTTYFSALERVAVADCRKEAYAAIAAQLLETGETWIPMTLVDETSSEGNVLPRLLRSPLRDWGSRDWEAGLARGTFNQMDDARRDAIDNLFAQARFASVTQNEIFTLQSRMKKLAVTTTISPDDRSRYYDLLGELDDKSAVLELFSSLIITLIGEVGFDLPDEFVEDALERLPRQNAFRETYFGACYVPMEYLLLDSSVSAELAQ
jgi:hypothetical protein